MGLIVEMYLFGRLEKDLSHNDVVEVDLEEAKENLAKFFGTTNVDMILRGVRGGRI